jgi:hypothetical protein
MLLKARGGRARHSVRAVRSPATARNCLDNVGVRQKIQITWRLRKETTMPESDHDVVMSMPRKPVGKARLGHHKQELTILRPVSDPFLDHQ